MRLDAEEHVGAGEVEPADQSSAAVEHLVLARPRGQSGDGEAAFDQPFEPAVGDPPADLTTVEQGQDGAGAGLARTVQPLGGQAQPVQARPTSLEVVDQPQAPVGVDDRTGVDDRAGQTGARYAVDADEILGWQWIDPVLHDVDAPDAATRATADHLDRRCLAAPVQSMQERRRTEAGVEAAAGERRDHHPLVPGRRRGADAQHSRCRFVEERRRDERTDLAGGEPECGSLASVEGTVLRGCELSNGAHGVVASHSGDQSYRRRDRIPRQRPKCRQIRLTSALRVGTSRDARYGGVSRWRSSARGRCRPRRRGSRWRPARRR